MYTRILASALTRLAKQYPVITLMGPRQSGKTTLCRMVFKDYAYVNLEDLEKRQLAIADPKGFLAQFNDKPVILDEIQRAPDLPSYIQVLVDEKNKSGHFILTGSQQFQIMHTLHQSLAGRTAILQLLPLAYAELYVRNTRLPLEDLLFRGFYPRIHDQSLDPTEAYSFYVSTYIERDLRQLMHVKDLNTFERFIKICAAHAGQLLNYSTISNDCGIDQKTVKSWLSLLEASYIVFFIKPHFKNFKKRLTKSSKLYFYDVGLLCYLLGFSKASHLKNHPLRGALFENFIVSEILKNRYNHVKSNNLYFFRDHVGNEIDLILDEGYLLKTIEIKSASTLNPSFFKMLEQYQSLNGAENTESYLVYGGSEKCVSRNVNVFPYTNLEEFLDLL